MRPPETGAVQHFVAGVVLLASGDTLHGPLTLHTELEVVSLTRRDNSTAAYPAGQVQLFAVQAATQPDPAAQELANEIARTPQLAQYYARVPSSHTYLSPAGARYYWDQTGRPPAQLAGRSRPYPADPQAVRLFKTFLWDRDRGALPAPAFFEQLTNGPYLLLRRQQPAVQGQVAEPFAPELTDHYYLTTADGPVQPLPNPRRDLPRALGAQGPALLAYAEQQRLRFDDTENLVQLVAHANLLLQPEPGD